MKFRIAPFALFSAALAAQPGATGIDPTKPPETPPIPNYRLPPISESKLPNGLTLVLVEDARFPMVTAQLNFQAGSKFDPADAPGLADAVAALLTEGTPTRTSRQISEEVDALGATLRARADADALTLGGDTLSENLPRFLALMADAARNASFPVDEVNLYKQNRAQALRAEHADAATLARERFTAVVYGVTPYGHILPTEASIAKLDQKALAAFHDRHLTPNTATLILIGKLPGRAELHKLIAERFGSWPRKPAPAAPAIAPPAPERRIVLVDRPGSVQANILAGRLAPVRTSPEYFPLAVGMTVLGGGANSRMFRDIREKQGFAYDAHAEYNTNREGASVAAVTQVRNAVIEPAMKAVLAELDGMATAPVPDKELDGTKNYLAGTFLLHLETQSGVAMQLNRVRTLGLPDSYLETFTARVRAVEPAQILEAAKKYLTPGQAAIVVVGDASKIGDALKKFGTVTVAKAE